jgi:hypothetical protein
VGYGVMQAAWRGYSDLGRNPRDAPDPQNIGPSTDGTIDSEASVSVRLPTDGTGYSYRYTPVPGATSAQVFEAMRPLLRIAAMEPAVRGGACHGFDATGPAVQRREPGRSFWSYLPVIRLEMAMGGELRSVWYTT